MSLPRLCTKVFPVCAEEYGDRLVMTQREYCHGDIIGSTLVIAATDNEAVNRAVFEEAAERSILINSADDPSNCSFFLPSSYRAGDLVMSISTGGSSPALAARLRRELQKHIPGNIETILAALNEARQLLKSSEAFSQLDTVRRGEILKVIVNDDARLEELRISYEKGSLEACLLGFLNAR